MNEILKLKFFPISFYAPTLGLAGFSLALIKAGHLYGFTSKVGEYAGWFAAVVYVIISFTYMAKFIKYNAEIKKDFLHPVKANFYPLMAMTLLIFSVILLEYNTTVSRIFWLTGVVVNTLFSLQILSSWIKHKFYQINHLSPAWFIPVVGNVIIPIAGVEHFNAEISWFFFATGFVWMIILTTIIFYRLIFHDPLPEKMVPTLFIMFAAPAVSFISYYKLTGVYDSVARIIFYFALFLFVLMTTQWKTFFKIKFYMSWWAYTFPLAAFSIANMLMYNLTQVKAFYYLAAVVLLLLAMMVILLVVLTYRAMKNDEVCVEE